MTDIRDMDPGELREFVVHQLAEAAEADYDADGVGWAIDRLAKTIDELPTVLRTLADDVENLLADDVENLRAAPTFDARRVASVDTVGGEYEVRTAPDDRYDVVSIWAPAGNVRVEETGFLEKTTAFEFAAALADRDVATETGDALNLAEAETRIVAARESR